MAKIIFTNSLFYHFAIFNSFWAIHWINSNNLQNKFVPDHQWFMELSLICNTTIFDKIDFFTVVLVGNIFFCWKIQTNFVYLFPIEEIGQILILVKKLYFSNNTLLIKVQVIVKVKLVKTQALAHGQGQV